MGDIPYPWIQTTRCVDLAMVLRLPWLVCNGVPYGGTDSYRGVGRPVCVDIFANFHGPEPLIRCCLNR